jgi:hypothetical protein
MMKESHINPRKLQFYANIMILAHIIGRVEHDEVFNLKQSFLVK